MAHLRSPMSHPTLRLAPDGDRWFSVTSLDEATPGDLTEVVQQLPSEPALLVLFAAPHLGHQHLLDAIGDAVPAVAMIGCTTSGIVDATGRFRSELQLVAIGGADLTAAAAGGTYAEGGPRLAGDRIGRATATGHQGRHRALLLLSDGLRGDVAEIIRGAYGALGAAVPLVGGCAGDDLAMRETTQFVNGTALTAGVVGARIESNAPIGIGVDHGWEPVGEPMVVTESNGTSILALDDHPALDMYLAAVGHQDRITDSAAFARFAQTRPLGLMGHGSGQPRFVTGGDLDRRSLEFLVHVPEGQLVWVMGGDRSSVLRATEAATRRAVDQLDGRPPLGVIAFDCVARRGVIGEDNVDVEVAALAGALPPDTPIGGFYTYGEIAHTGGALGLHHQTMVVCALS